MRIAAVPFPNTLRPLLVSLIEQHHRRYQSADGGAQMGTAQPPGPEAGNPAYVRMARFRRDVAAKRFYTEIQEAIRTAECDLSVYNLRFNGEPTVVVLGDAPPAGLDERLRKMLSAGTPAVLPPDVIVMLTERSIRERRKGPWREGHYDPGKRLI